MLGEYSYHGSSCTKRVITSLGKGVVESRFPAPCNPNKATGALPIRKPKGLIPGPDQTPRTPHHAVTLRRRAATAHCAVQAGLDPDYTQTQRLARRLALQLLPNTNHHTQTIPLSPTAKHQHNPRLPSIVGGGGIAYATSTTPC